MHFNKSKYYHLSYKKIINLNLHILKNKSKQITLIILALLITSLTKIFSQKQPSNEETPQEVRAFFVSSLIKIGDPVLKALSENKLHKLMPQTKETKHDVYLEAFARLLSGMSSWLELGPDETPEGLLRAEYIDLARTCIANLTNPNSPDFIDFINNSNQNKAGILVDAAFFAQALIRAPKQLWEPLDAITKERVIKALKATRNIKPGYNNWLLFSGMIEAALFKFDSNPDILRLDYGLKKHKEWYLGDGMYGDGAAFHWDYYNSFVIHPMILDILKTINEKNNTLENDYNTALKRAKRYAAIQERLISPDGTYPPIGRSLAYRFGAFQLLSQISLFKELPEDIKPSQVRSALYTMVNNQLNAPGTFDENGWLEIGFYGKQPNIGEKYITTGSLYLCSEVFLILGLPTSDPFWSDPYQPWTQKKIWSGQNIPIDYALKN